MIVKKDIMTLRAALSGVLLAWLLAMTGCVLPSRTTPPIASLATLQGIDDDTWAVTPQPRNMNELLLVTGEMQRFVEMSVNRRLDRQRRIEQLTNAVLHPGSLGLRYNDRVTRSAAEAFDTANGNCLTLSMLFVALAREAGIDASFYEVNVVPEWTLAGDVVFATRHINVGGNINANSTYVMDFSPYVVRREIGRQRLTDAQALAQYYNNIGAEYLAAGNLPAAYLQFRAGLELAPRISFLWSNLSVAYSRNGQIGDAEAALRVAIGLDDDNTSAMTNLAKLLAERGDDAAANTLLDRIQRAQRTNPYYQFAMGERHLVQHRYAQALIQLELAITLEPGEPLFYERAAAAARELDQPELADDYAAMATGLTTREQQRRRDALGF